MKKTTYSEKRVPHHFYNHRFKLHKGIDLTKIRSGTIRKDSFLRIWSLFIILSLVISYIGILLIGLN